jgi:hypothetical protein
VLLQAKRGRPGRVDDVGEATRGPGAPQSLRRKGLAGRASEAPTADDDFPAVLTPAEPGHAVRAERADELGTNDLRLGVWERHVQDAMAAIITALIVLHRTLSVARAVPTQRTEVGCAARLKYSDLQGPSYEESCSPRGGDCVSDAAPLP